MNSNAYFLWEKVCKTALKLPGVSEKVAYGTPALYVEKKLFARLKEDKETLVVYNNDRDQWIASDPETFFFTQHYKNYPMLLANLKTVSTTDLERLILVSWKIRASKKLSKDYNG
jgi:hypothetical protein